MESKPVTVATGLRRGSGPRTRPSALRAHRRARRCRRYRDPPGTVDLRRSSLETLRDVIAEQGLFAIYSAPLELWRADGVLAVQALRRVRGSRDTGSAFPQSRAGPFSRRLPISELAGLLAGGSPRLLIETTRRHKGSHRSTGGLLLRRYHRWPAGGNDLRYR